jgi:ribosome-binding factor A
MRFYRSQRVESLIAEELGKIIVREVEFPIGSLTTIVSVDVDKKMDRAKVFVSVIPALAKDAALNILKARTGELQHLLMKKINIKPMPRIIFEIDYGHEHAAVVEKVLKDEGMENVRT